MAKASKEIYDTYKEMSKSPVDYSTFKKILIEFNTEIMNTLLKGKTFNMGYKLSTLSIWRRKRDPRTPRVNWGESLKIKRDLIEKGIEPYNSTTGKGEKWIVYFTDGQYFRFRWYKDKCRVKNKTVYKFEPTRGVKGNKQKLINLINNDDLAYLRFKEYKNGDL